MEKILVIEDERPIARLLELALTHEGYQVHAEYDGLQGLCQVPRYEPDLILLDIMLPGMDGMEVCRKIREFSFVPILMLTSRDETADKIAGLDLGANDYITKPFDMKELLARIRAALRNRQEPQERLPVLAIRDLWMDVAKRVVTRTGTAVSLTKREFDLLEYLMRNRGVVLSRNQILDAVWGLTFEGEANVVDVFIRYLRAKVDDPFETSLIHTVRGFGYVLEDRCANA